MTRRTSIVEQVRDYFSEVGKPLTADEYKAAEDAPVRFQLIKRNIGSWARLLNMVGPIEPKVLEPAVPPVKEVQVNVPKK